MWFHPNWWRSHVSNVHFPDRRTISAVVIAAISFTAPIACDSWRSYGIQRLIHHAHRRRLSEFLFVLKLYLKFQTSSNTFRWRRHCKTNLSSHGSFQTYESHSSVKQGEDKGEEPNLSCNCLFHIIIWLRMLVSTRRPFEETGDISQSLHQTNLWDKLANATEATEAEKHGRKLQGNTSKSKLIRGVN